MKERFVNQGSSVEQIFEDVRGYWKSSVIITAIDLDIFTNVNDGISNNELAKKLDLDENALVRLLDALVSLNILQKEQEYYYNTFIATKYLIKENNPNYIGHIVLYHKSRYDVWGNLGKSIKTGKALTSASFLTPDKEQINNYARAMSARAKLEVYEVLERIQIQNYNKVLDLGGAPGTFAVAFAKKNPSLNITVFDLPDMMEISREITSGLNNITLKEGNFVNDDIGSGFDVVFMSQILDSLGKELVKTLFKKVYNALGPNGQLIIRDYILRSNNTEPEVAIFRSLNVLLTTKSGQLYSIGDYLVMLREVGFKDLQFLELQGPTDLIIGTKKE